LLEEACTPRDCVCESWLEAPKLAGVVGLLEKLDSRERMRLGCSGETEADGNKLVNEDRMLDSAGLLDNLGSRERIRLDCSGKTVVEEKRLATEVTAVDLAGKTVVGNELLREDEDRMLDLAVENDIGNAVPKEVKTLD